MRFKHLIVATATVVAALAFGSSANAGVVMYEYTFDNFDAQASDVLSVSGGGGSLSYDPDGAATNPVVKATGYHRTGSNVNFPGTITSGSLLTGRLIQDLSPIHGGLGVCEQNTGGCGSGDEMDGVTSADLILFEWTIPVSLGFVELNDGPNHGEFITSADDIDIFYESAAGTFTRIVENGVPTGSVNSDDIVNVPSGTFSNKWLVGVDFTTDTVYIERIKISANVPEPASLVLVGLGLAGLGFAVRRRRALCA